MTGIKTAAFLCQIILGGNAETCHAVEASPARFRQDSQTWEAC